jgi:predicted transcriptional regulator
MTTFTSTLPNDLIASLNKMASRYSLPKNKIIEKALRIYLDQLVKAEYIRSYKQASGDFNILMMAEEGMADYLKQFNNETM